MRQFRSGNFCRLGKRFNLPPPAAEIRLRNGSSLRWGARDVRLANRWPLHGSPPMFANLSKLTPASTLLALLIAVTTANAQQRVAVRSNPNIQRPMPVAARSISQPPGMARVVRQEQL